MIWTTAGQYHGGVGPDICGCGERRTGEDRRVNMQPQATLEDIPTMFPGAVYVANLLRTMGWFVVGAFILGACTVGGAIGGASDIQFGAYVGAALGALVGGLAGALYTSIAFAVAYALLLLNEIEINTRMSAQRTELSVED